MKSMAHATHTDVAFYLCEKYYFIRLFLCINYFFFQKIKLQANLQFNLGDLKTEGTTSSLILLPPKLNPFGSQLQITSSTKKPKLGENIILHVRSNFDLEDFHCVVTSRGRLLTTRLISMGHTKLKVRSMP